MMQSGQCINATTKTNPPILSNRAALILNAIARGLTPHEIVSKIFKGQYSVGHIQSMLNYHLLVIWGWHISSAAHSDLTQSQIKEFHDLFDANLPAKRRFLQQFGDFIEWTANARN